MDINVVFNNLDMEFFESEGIYKETVFQAFIPQSH